MKVRLPARTASHRTQRGWYPSPIVRATPSILSRRQLVASRRQSIRHRMVEACYVSRANSQSHSAIPFRACANLVYILERSEPRRDYADASRGPVMNPTKPGSLVSNDAPSASTQRDTLTVIDNRTGRQFELPIKNDTIHALDLRQIKVHDRRFRDDGLRPGLHQHGARVQQDHLSLTATKGSCATAAIRSRSWLKKAPISKRPT